MLSYQEFMVTIVISRFGSVNIETHSHALIFERHHQYQVFEHLVMDMYLVR